MFEIDQGAAVSGVKEIGASKPGDGALARTSGRLWLADVSLGGRVIWYRTDAEEVQLGIGRIAILLSTSMLAAALAGCGEGKRASSDATPVVVMTAEAITVRERLAPDYKAVSAVVTNRDAGDARARIAGRLSQLLVREGDLVKRNQLVAVVSDERIANEARAGAAAEAAALAMNDQAQRDLKRAETLFAQGAIAQAAIESARTQAQAASASLRAAKAQAEAARALQLQGEIRAPADGKVVRAAIPQGSVVMAGDLVASISTGAQVLRVELPESEGKSLVAGAAITLASEGDGARVQTTKVRQVYPAVANGRVTADLDAADIDAQFIGGRVRVLIPVGQRQAIVIPQRYIDTRYGADYVRLSREGGAIDVPIQRGLAIPLPDAPDGVEVLSGLRSGDVILPIGAAQ